MLHCLLSTIAAHCFHALPRIIGDLHVFRLSDALHNDIKQTSGQSPDTTSYIIYLTIMLPGDRTQTQHVL